MLKVSLAARPPRSVAVDLDAERADVALAGVPLKVRVVALNVSHAGSAEPSDDVAV